MMNKVLVLVYVPMLEKKYEVWIPINRKIHVVISLITMEINHLTEIHCSFDNLYNRQTDLIYDKNAVIKDTDIRNGSELILL